MVSPRFYQQRLQDLDNNIAKDWELVKEYEDAFRTAEDPKQKLRYQDEIRRLRASVTGYQQEFDELQQKLVDEPSAKAQIQKTDSQLQQVDAKLNALLGGQEAISKDLAQMRRDLLNRYDAGEQAIVSDITKKLDQTELVLTLKILEALEANQVSDQEMEQMLAALKTRIPSLPPKQAAVIKDPELDTKHKLKVTLPIVPMLVDYEGEVELGSGFNIKSAWNQLVDKLWRREP